MDLCHLKSSELEPEFQKYKGRVVLRGDIAKDSGAHAVFPEQGSSASQMTAAKVMDVSARLLDCDGQTADVISARPGKNGGCSKTIFKFPNQNVRTFGYVYHDTSCLNHGPVWKTQSFLLSEIFLVIFQQDCNGKGHFKKILLEYGWEKVSNWECLFVHREKGLFLSVFVDDIKLAGKKQNIDPMWRLLNKEVDLGEPTSFVDHVNLGRTQRQMVLLERNLHGHPLAGLLWERQIEKALKELGWEKVPNWECLLVHRKQKLFLSVYVDDIKMAGKKQNLALMWKKLMKDVYIEEPTSFLRLNYWTLQHDV